MKITRACGACADKPWMAVSPGGSYENGQWIPCEECGGKGYIEEETP